MGEIKYIYES